MRIYEIKIVIAHFLYWNCSRIKVSFLASMLSCRTGQVCQLVGPNITNRLCGKCGDFLWASSRQNLKEISSNLKRKQPRWAEGYRNVCQSCKDDIYNERSKRSLEQQVIQQINNEQRSTFLKSMPYQDYLHTEHWTSFSKKAKRRAGYRCQLCNNNGLLHVHHNTYERRGCEKYKDVLVLCDKCHAKFHDKE